MNCGLDDYYCRQLHCDICNAVSIYTMCSYKNDETCPDPEQCQRAGCANKPGHAPSPIECAMEQMRKATCEVFFGGLKDLLSKPEIPAARILRKAADLVEQRAASRDKPDGEKSMLATVKAFNAIYGTQLTEVQGWHFMELLKMVRSAQGVYVADDYDDKVAYAALAAEAAEGEKT